MRDFITSIRLTVVSLAICAVAYPAVVLAVAAVLAPEARQGSLIRTAGGDVVGSRLIAQGFTKPEYFWPRPSAVDYNAAAAGGSNLSPAGAELTQQARERLARLSPAGDQRVPVDLVLASGSGLDPQISLSAALFQLPRVAKSRGMPAAEVQRLVQAEADSPALQWLGAEPLVNVLVLNLSLDEYARRK